MSDAINVFENPEDLARCTTPSLVRWGQQLMRTVLAVEHYQFPGESAPLPPQGMLGGLGDLFMGLLGRKEAQPSNAPQIAANATHQTRLDIHERLRDFGDREALVATCYELYDIVATQANRFAEQFDALDQTIGGKYDMVQRAQEQLQDLHSPAEIKEQNAFIAQTEREIVQMEAEWAQVGERWQRFADTTAQINDGLRPLKSIEIDEEPYDYHALHALLDSAVDSHTLQTVVDHLARGHLGNDVALLSEFDVETDDLAQAEKLTGSLRRIGHKLVEDLKREGALNF